MPSPLEQLFNTESIVDADFGIRIPDTICRALRLKPDDRVLFRIDQDGTVRLERVGQAAASPQSELSPLFGLIDSIAPGEGGKLASRAATSGAGTLGTLQTLMKIAMASADEQNKLRSKTD